MSSLPGLTLESFVLWNYDLVVDGQPEANVSLGMAEALKNIDRRKSIPPEAFAYLVSMFEPHREHVENCLEAFDEETQSWRDYSSVIYIPEQLFAAGRQYIDGLTIEDHNRQEKIKKIFDSDPPLSIKNSRPRPFEIGKYYQHSGGGSVMHIICEIHTFFHGKCFLAEDDDGSLRPIGTDSTARQNWSEVSGWPRSTYGGNNIPDPAERTTVENPVNPLYARVMDMPMKPGTWPEGMGETIRK